LEKKVADLQTELSQKDFAIDFESLSNINRVAKHINDDVAWNTKNAALLVNLSDNLKVEKQRINAEITAAQHEKKTLEEGQDSIVYLKTVDLNTLYQSLLSVNSTGIESARNYIRLLTNIGSQISAAMHEMTEENKKIQALHAELGDLDKKIIEFGLPVEVLNNESIDNESTTS
jgi:predicted  nucleic acid-binding Zn-ribbon protein